LASVQKFVEFFNVEFDDLHILINNAGAWPSEYRETDDALEEGFQINHLSHFYLTNALLGKLVASGTVEEPARVVTVSSALHERGELDWDDIEAGRSQRAGEFGGMQAYSNTKLMNGTPLHALLWFSLWTWPRSPSFVISCVCSPEYSVGLITTHTVCHVC
jgi:NAD(P)-dependent dehydrogenase (short-subunit alcohol dehydrogenase family)